MGQHLPQPQGSAGPSTSPALPQRCREKEADAPVHPLEGSCTPVEGRCHPWWARQRRGSGASVPCRAVLAWGASCWCGCQGPVRTRPASSRQTCCRHIQCSQGSSSQLLPPTNRSPTWPAPWEPPLGTHWPLAHAPCPAPPASLGSRPRSLGTAHGCSPTTLTAFTGVQSVGQNLSVQAGPGTVAQHGTAQHGTMLSWLSRWVSASCPTQQVPHLLEPPRPWPAVMGACGGATSTPESCSTLSQGALTAAQTTAPSQASQHRTGWALLAGSSWIQPPSGSTAVGGSPTRHSCQG